MGNAKLIQSFAAALCSCVVVILVALSMNSARADSSLPTQAQLPRSPVTVMVTRNVNGRDVTLPAALVPMLEPNDRVHAEFEAFDRRHIVDQSVAWNFHSDLIFINGIPPYQFFFTHGKSTDDVADALFLGQDPKAINFTYANTTGTPIFFIIPDNRAGGDDGGAHNYIYTNVDTFFSKQATASSNAVTQSAFASSFLNGLASGAVSLDQTGKAYVKQVMGGIGVDKQTTETCYAGTPSPAKQQIQRCLESLVLQQIQPTSGAATATDNGRLIGMASSGLIPAHLNPYLFAGYALYKIFFSRPAPSPSVGYEFLNSTLIYDPPQDSSASIGGTEYVATAKVLKAGRDNAHHDVTPMDVIFFSLGGDKTAPPTISLDNGSSNGLCATGSQVTLPLKISASSPYLHDIQLTAALRNFNPIPIRVEDATGDIMLPRLRINELGTHAYPLELHGWFGFKELASSGRVMVAIPGSAPWYPDTRSDDVFVSGAQAAKLVLSSDAAPCLQSAELKQGLTRVNLDVSHLDDTHVQLTMNLTNFIGGTPATLLLHQMRDIDHLNRDITDNATIPIGVTMPSSDANQTAYLGDSSILVTGKNLDGADAVVLKNIMTFDRDFANSDASKACFVGHEHQTVVSGVQVNRTTAGMFAVTNDSQGHPTGPFFSIMISQQRPAILLPTVHRETDPGQFELPMGAVSTNSKIAVEVTKTPLPGSYHLQLRQQPRIDSPCAALGALDLTAKALPQDDLAVLDQSSGTLSLIPSAILKGNQSFGVLQLSILDEKRNVQSDWVSMPVSFVREPTIDSIDCTHGDQCWVVGSDLYLITKVSDGRQKARTTEFCGALAKPPSGKSCLLVPKYSEYRFELNDLRGVWVRAKELNVTR